MPFATISTLQESKTSTEAKMYTSLNILLPIPKITMSHNGKDSQKAAELTYQVLQKLIASVETESTKHIPTTVVPRKQIINEKNQNKIEKEKLNVTSEESDCKEKILVLQH